MAANFSSLSDSGCHFYQNEKLRPSHLVRVQWEPVPGLTKFWGHLWQDTDRFGGPLCPLWLLPTP